jgi:type IV pilus assembly protein PilC
MPNYLYEAVDASGLMNKGSLEVIDQSEALQRIKEMGLFPTQIRPVRAGLRPPPTVKRRKAFQFPIRLGARRIKPAALAVFTRQLATLVDVGMPLLRGLHILQKQEANPEMKRVIGAVAQTIESGGTMAEALAAHPKVFSPLYVNMVRAGEAGGIVDEVLRRQAEFLEKSEQIKGKIKAAMFYPVAVMLVAAGIMSLLLVFVIPRFQSVFDGLLGGRRMPAFTLAVFQISELVRSHILAVSLVLAAMIVAFQLLLRTQTGRRWFDGFKLIMPVMGAMFRKASLARLARTLGTLLGSGVPVLQALVIVKETAGNVVVGEMVTRIHASGKEGGTIAEPFKAAKIFPDMVAGMVDVGEQTGALPDMLLKVADTSDAEVDNAVTAMTSLLEPVMIVFLAFVVGSIVIAMFWPLVILMQDPMGTGGDGQ